MTRRPDSISRGLELLYRQLDDVEGLSTCSTRADRIEAAVRELVADACVKERKACARIAKLEGAVPNGFLGLFGDGYSEAAEEIGKQIRARGAK